jgi:Ca2+-binding RTX toxin-like protein
MQARSFKQLFASAGPDQVKSPALSRTARLAKAVRPIVSELLEYRRMLSLTISNPSGVLTIQGDNTAQQIDVYYDAGMDSIRIDEDGGTAAIYSLSAVSGHLIKIFGGGGNDSINCWGGNQGRPSAPYSCEIHGDDGNDVITGSDNNDNILGGVGYDTIHGWDGNDFIYGGTASGDSSDSVTGNDILYGDAGADTVKGEGGDDLIYGGEGVDALYGGDGNDTIRAHEDISEVGDSLFGGNGNDCGYWNSSLDTVTGMEGNFTP